MPKKTPKQTRFLINDEIYSTDIFVFTGGEVNKARDWLNKKYGKDLQVTEQSPHTYAAFICNKDFKGTALWFKWPKPPARIVAHEVFHAAHHILSRSGLTLTDDSEEAYAYYIEWLTRKIVNKLW